MSGSPQGATRGLGVRLLLVLSLLAATAPLSVDFYLASFPEVRSSLHTDASTVQLTLTGFLLGLGLGQIGWGPISDRYGRLRPLLVGATVGTLAAACAALAPSIGILIAARFVQALAGAAGIVICRAVIADLLDGYAAARAMSLMLTINGLAPIVAPVVGGALAGHVPWRGVLGIIVAVYFVQLVGIAVVIRESLPAERRTPRVQYAYVGRLLARPAYLGYTITSMFAFGAMMAYISSSSFVYQSVIGTSGLVYGLLFGCNAVGLMAGGAASARLARHQVHPARTVARALPVIAVGAVLLLLIASTGVTKWLLIVPLFFVVTSVGFVIGNVQTLAIEQSRDVAGAGSAVVGGLTFLFAGVVSPLGGLKGDDTAVPFALVMLCSSACALAIFWLTRAYVRRHPELERSFERADASVATADAG